METEHKNWPINKCGFIRLMKNWSLSWTW